MYCNESIVRYTYIDLVCRGESKLTNEIAILSRQLDLLHQDPSDRFIAATAVYYNLTLATVDRNLISATCLQTLS